MHRGMSLAAVVLLVFVSGLAFSGLARAETPTPPADDAENNTSSLAELDQVELLARSESVIREVERMETVLALPEEVKELGKRLIRERETLNREAEAARADVLEASRWYHVRDIHFEFTQSKQRLAVTREPLDSFARTISGTPERIDEILEEWKRARDLLAKVNAPKAVLKRADEVLSVARLARMRADRALSDLAQTQAAIERMERINDEILALTEKDGASLLTHFSRPRVSPLSTPWPTGPQIKQALAGSFARNKLYLQTFVSGAKPKVVFHFTLLLALIFALFRARFYYKKAAPLELDEHPVLRHPMAGAFLLSAIVVLPLYDAVPAVVGLTAIVVGISAVNVLLHAQTPKSVVVRLNSFALLILVGAHLFFTDLGRLEGLLVLCEALVVITAAVPLLHQTTGAWKGGWMLFSRFVGRMWLIAAVTGVILRVLGFERPSIILIDGSARLILATLTLHVGYSVASSVLALGLRSPWAQNSRALRLHGHQVTEQLSTVLRWGLLYLWANIASETYGLRAYVAEKFAEFLALSLEVGTLSFSVGGVGVLALGILVAVLGAKLVRFILDEELLSRTQMSLGSRSAVTSGVYYVILGFGAFSSLAAAGFELDRIAILVSALGVGIGFGLQNIVQNFVAGILLIFGRPINVGNTIQVGELLGRVGKIGVRASTIHTFDGAEVIVPNSEFVSQRVINWTLSSERRRVEVDVGVKYGTEPQLVLDILLKAAKAHPETLSDPAPEAIFISFGDNSLNFRLRAWTENGGNWMVIRSDLSIAIDAALKEANIEIPFPQRDLHLRSVDPQAAAGLLRSAERPSR